MGQVVGQNQRSPVRADQGQPQVAEREDPGQPALGRRRPGRASRSIGRPGGSARETASRPGSSRSPRSGCRPPRREAAPARRPRSRPGAPGCRSGWGPAPRRSSTGARSPCSARRPASRGTSRLYEPVISLTITIEVNGVLETPAKKPPMPTSTKAAGLDLGAGQPVARGTGRRPRRACRRSASTGRTRRRCRRS